MTIKLSEQVRRLEDTIESLRAENKKLKGPQQIPQISYKGKVTERPEEGEDGDLYYVELSDGTTCEVIRCNGELIPFSRLREMYDKSDYTKKLETELKARVEQVENLQDTLKKITKENLELQDRLKKCENLNRKCTEKRGEEESHPYSKSIADDIDFVNDIKKLYGSIFKR